MALDKAKEFLKMLAKDAELQKKMSGFTLDELKEAAQDMKKSGELSAEDLNKIGGGFASSYVGSSIT